MTFEEHIAESRLIFQNRIPDDHGRLAMEQAISPFLKYYKVDLAIYDTFTSLKRAQCIKFEGRQYMVLDHALVNYFHLLNALFHLKCPPDLTIAALQLSLAEACRNANLLKHYAFFIKRAYEVRSVVRRIVDNAEIKTNYNWQNFIVVAHEAAHALPADCDLIENLRINAMLTISMEVNEILFKTSRLLTAIINDEEIEDAPAREEDLIDFLKAIEYDPERISQVFLKKAGDKQFREEIICDKFAVLMLRDVLQKDERFTQPENCQEIITAILLAVHRTFLNMRFFKYTDDIVELAGLNTEEKINPLRLGGLVEFTIRGNLFVKELLEVWESFGFAPKDSTKETFARELLQNSNRHTDQFFVPFNEFAEANLLNSEFSNILNACLEEDGFDLDLFHTAPFGTLERIDDLWQEYHLTSSHKTGHS